MLAIEPHPLLTWMGTSAGVLGLEGLPTPGGALGFGLALSTSPALLSAEPGALCPRCLSFWFCGGTAAYGVRGLDSILLLLLPLRCSPYVV